MRRKILYTLLFIGLAALHVSAQQSGNRRGSAYYEEMVGNLTNRMRLLQDENAALSGNVHALQQEIRQMKQQMQAYRAELEQLRRMLSEESAARQKQVGGIADRIQRAADAQAKAEADARARAAADAAKADPRIQDTESEEYD